MANIHGKLSTKLAPVNEGLAMLETVRSLGGPAAYVESRKIGANQKVGVLSNRFRAFADRLAVTGSRQNYLFAAKIEPNATLTEKVIKGFEHAGLMCSAANFPSPALLTTQYREDAAMYEVPYGIAHDPLVLTFYCSGDMREYKTFVKWQAEIYSKDRNKLKFMDDYRTNMWLFLLSTGSLNEAGSVGQLLLKGAYPKTIGSLNLSHADTALSQFTVEFQYETRIFADYGDEELAAKIAAANRLQTSGTSLFKSLVPGVGSLNSAIPELNIGTPSGLMGTVASASNNAVAGIRSLF